MSEGWLCSLRGARSWTIWEDIFVGQVFFFGVGGFVWDDFLGIFGMCSFLVGDSLKVLFFYTSNILKGLNDIMSGAYLFKKGLNETSLGAMAIIYIYIIYCHVHISTYNPLKFNVDIKKEVTVTTMSKTI